MESIETGYLLELQALAEGSIDIQFQAWMAISFAVIVATYAGRRELGTPLRILIVILYTMASYALFARWMTEADRLELIQTVLLSRGLDFYPILYAFEARIATYFFGSLATIAAVFMFRDREPST